jgi:peptidyl-prolyl cis-trans isomerase B (cyclophilin B)
MSNTKRPSSSASGSTGTPAGTKVIIALIALLCVGAVVWIGVSVTGDEDAGGSDTTAPTSSGEVGTPEDCAVPPEAPESPASYSEAPDASVAEGAVWEATVRTNCGVITMELYGDRAPQTVASFVMLAEDGYWVDSPCHRVTTQVIFVLQCGDPTGTGTGAPGYTFPVENPPTDGTYPRGTLAMARGSDPNTNGGQWFIVYDETSLPDPNGYTIFGEVTDGMEVVDAIAEAGVADGSGDGSPTQPISVLDITVEQQA